jgi:hypothetical protein
MRYDQALIERWLSLYTLRLPREGILDVIVRLL